MTYRAAVVGAGRPPATAGAPGFEGFSIGYSHGAAYTANPDTELAAVVDISSENAAAFAEHFGSVTAYGDFEEMLAAERPDIVSICTWPTLHRDMTIAALRAGVGMVLCEKPMGVSVGDVDDMVAAAAETGGRLFVNHQRRFAMPYEGLHDMIREGALGEIVRMEAWVGNGWDLMSWGTHWVDMLRYFAGDLEAEWVLAAAPSSGQLRYGHEVEDQMLLQLRFREGPLALVHCGPHLEGFGLTVTGTEAVVTIDGNRVTVYGAGDADAGRLRAVIQDTPHSNDPQERAIADIVRAYRTGEPSRIEGTHGRAATEIIMAAYQSARTGAVVTFPLADRSIDLRPAVSVG